jgi:hypothetical protein
MLGLPKLVLIVLVAVAVWYVGRRLSGPGRNLQRRRPASPPPAPPALEAEDLVPCKVCGAYVAAGAPGCGRRDCPQRR